MSEPQREATTDVTPGQEPGAGISDPETVVPGTLPPTREAATDAQLGDPGGYPHEPAGTVPPVPSDDPEADAARRHHDDP